MAARQVEVTTLHYLIDGFSYVASHREAKDEEYGEEKWAEAWI